MDRWKQFLRQKDNRQEDAPLEIERDARFVSWLEEAGQFEARRGFQKDLRARLQTQLVNQVVASKPTSHRSPLLLRLTSTVAGVVVVLIFGLALISGLPVPDNAVATPVAAVPSYSEGTVPVKPTGEKFSYVYDQINQDYVNLEEVNELLGFAPRLPDYLPQGYRIENIALTYSENGIPGPVRSGGAPINPNNPARPGPQGLQFQLVPGRPQDTNQMQVYQLRAPAEEANGARFNVQGAQSSNPKTIQGAIGYFIQGARWRLNYAGTPPPAISSRNARPAEETSPGPPKNGTPGPPVRPPFVNGTPGNNKRPPFPPQNFRPAQGRLSFGQLENGSNPNRPSFFIDFQPRADGKPARSLVWQKDGVLLMLVTTDTFPDAELQRIADSFR